MSVEWPLVLADDDGIRPAGSSHACFYCKKPVGEPHGLDCVIVQKKARVRYTFELEVEIPHHWDADDFASHRLESSSCANNIVRRDFGYAVGEYGCLCAFLKGAELLGFDTTPIRRTRDASRERDRDVREWESGK